MRRANRRASAPHHRRARRIHAPAAAATACSLTHRVLPPQHTQHTRAQTARAATRLCLHGLGVARDTLGAAGWAELPGDGALAAPLPETLEGEGLLPGLTRGQFRRLPRVGARGFGPTALRYNVFKVGNFSGDFTMSRAKYAWRIPGAPLVLPRPMAACGGGGARAADAPLPGACDATATRAGRAQGYAPFGGISHELLAALPDRDTLRLGPKWPTCALVGGHAARGAPGAGAAIDAADAVIRVAPPPPRKRNTAAAAAAAAPPPPPELAGRRTTVRVLGPAAADAVSSGGTDRQQEGLHSVHKPAVQLRIITSGSALNATLRWQHANPFADVAVADPDFHQLALDAHGAARLPLFGLPCIPLRIAPQRLFCSSLHVSAWLSGR
jgi:hypothetical protein